MTCHNRNIFILFVMSNPPPIEYVRPFRSSMPRELSLVSSFVQYHTSDRNIRWNFPLTSKLNQTFPTPSERRTEPSARVISPSGHAWPHVMWNVEVVDIVRHMIGGGIIEGPILDMSTRSKNRRRCRGFSADHKSATAQVKGWLGVFVMSNLAVAAFGALKSAIRVLDALESYGQ